MKKRGITFLMTMVLAASCMSVSGITAYAGDLALAAESEGADTTIEGQSADLASVTGSVTVTDEAAASGLAMAENTWAEGVQENDVVEAPQADEIPEEEVPQAGEDAQTFENEGTSDEPEEVLLLDEPTEENLTADENVQDIPEEDGDTQETPVVNADTVLTVSNIEVVDESGIQTIQTTAAEISSVVFSENMSYNSLDNMLPIYRTLPVTIIYEDGSQQMLSSWEEELYYFWDMDDVDPRLVYDSETLNGDRIILTAYRDGQMIDFPGSMSKSFVGEFELRVYRESISETNEIKSVQNNKIVLSLPSANVTEMTNIIDGTLEVGGEKKYYHISAQKDDKILHAVFDESLENGYGDVTVYEKNADELSCSLDISLGIWDGEYDTYCRLNKGKEYWIVLEGRGNEGSLYAFTMSLEESQVITSISTSIVSAGVEQNTCDVEESGSVFWDYIDVHVKYSSATGAVTEEKVTEWRVNPDHMCMTAKTKYHDEIIIELKDLNDSYVNMPEDYRCIVLPGNYKIVAHVKDKEIWAEEVPFTVTCDNGIEPLVLDKDHPIESSAGISLGVEYKLFSFTPVRSGYYIFDFPTDSTEKIADVSFYDSNSCCLGQKGFWDADEEEIPASRTLYGYLKSRKAYYFMVRFYSPGAHTAVRLSKEYTVTSMALEALPTETTYSIEYDVDDDCYYVNAKTAGMKVRVNYSDGSSQVLGVDAEDEEFFDLGYCPFNADGSPDLSRIKSIYSPVDPGEVGAYAFLAGEGEWDDAGRLYFPDTPVWVKIEIVSKYHVHSWNAPTVEVAPTCTTEGKQSIYCSSCGEMKPNSTTSIPKLAHSWNEPTIEVAPTCTTEGKQSIYCSSCGEMKPDSTTSIPKLSHSWSDWSIATPGQAVLTRTCTVCHTSESQNFTPVLTLTDGKLAMKTGQSTTKFKVTAMEEYDSLASVKSSNTKLLKVSNIAADGTFKLKAQKKTGTVQLTVTLKSGATRTIKVKIQKAKVKTTNVKVEEKKLTLEKKQKMKLTPVITPVTSYDKVKYTSSNKKVAVVNNKGQITAKSKGTATITVKSGKKKVKIKVTVK